MLEVDHVGELDHLVELEQQVVAALSEGQEGFHRLLNFLNNMDPLFRATVADRQSGSMTTNKYSLLLSDVATTSP